MTPGTLQYSGPPPQAASPPPTHIHPRAAITQPAQSHWTSLLPKPSLSHLPAHHSFGAQRILLCSVPAFQPSQVQMPALCLHTYVTLKFFISPHLKVLIYKTQATTGPTAHVSGTRIKWGDTGKGLKTWHRGSSQETGTTGGVLFLTVTAVAPFHCCFLYSMLSYQGHIKLPFYCKAIQTPSSQ